ncbi:MAG: purine permease, partial [Castellaniella sp.]
MNTPARTAPPRPEDEALGLAANLMYGFQHVLTMYGGIIAVPLIVGQAAGLGGAEIGVLIASC